MKEHPILFSTPMVQAILEGRKKMTRRVIKPQPEAPRAIYNEDECIGIVGTNEKGSGGLLRFNWRCERYLPKTLYQDAGFYTHKCPYGKIGDVLWVRETFRIINHSGYSDPYFYKANACGTDLRDKEIKWKPSIFMPRIASRILLEITNIKVERLQDISDGDVVKEGVIWNEPLEIGRDNRNCKSPAQRSFRRLWDKINGEKSWEENSWCWVIEFKKL